MKKIDCHDNSEHCDVMKLPYDIMLQQFPKATLGELA